MKLVANNSIEQQEHQNSNKNNKLRIIRQTIQTSRLHNSTRTKQRFLQTSTGHRVSCERMHNKVPSFKVFTPVAGKVMRYYCDGIYGWIVADTVLEIVNRSLPHYEIWRLWWVLKQWIITITCDDKYKILVILAMKITRATPDLMKGHAARRCVIVRGSMDRFEHQV